MKRGLSTYKKIYFFTKVVVFILVLLFPVFLNAQVSRSVYFQKQLPGANVLNPAFNPGYKFYVNLPMISSLYMGFESPFSYSELTEKWENGDSLYIDRDAVMGTLNETNYFSFELYNELGRIGFGAGRHYLHFSIAKVFTTKFSFEKEIMALFLYGNASPQFFGKTSTFDKTGLNMSSYHQFSLGYSFQITKKLSFGTSLKYLNGAFNIWSEKAKFSIYTDSQPNFEITAASDILLHTSSTITDFDNMVDQIVQYGWFDLSNNHGYGFDFGLQYDPSKHFSLSASVIDIGWIKWQQDVKNFVSANPGKEFTFRGFDINDFVNNGSFSDSVNFADTLTNHFGLIENNDPYTSHLNPKVYLGGNWKINKSNDLGLLVRADLAETFIQPSVTINYTHRFGNWMSVYGNYTIISRSYTNIGLGFSVKMGPVQLYILNDMAYALLEPGEARNYNFQFGINFLFGKIKEPVYSGISKKSITSDLPAE